MKKSNGVFIRLLFFFVIFISCKQQKKDTSFDTAKKGTIHISVDESFRPVIEEQIHIYELSNPETKIIAEYKSESDCLRDLFRDSATRLILITRGLFDKEERFFMDSIRYAPGWNKIASDAIAIIVNNVSTDSLWDIEKLKMHLSGKSKQNLEFVFDGLNATSTYRFIKDSVLKGENIDTSIVRAAKNSEAVIDYVATHEQAVGLIGYSWIGNPEDSKLNELSKKVKTAFIRCEPCLDTPYIRPSQYTIASQRYPLVKGLYYIIKENYPGLGSGFVNFLKYERGQLLFRRSYLAPEMNFGIRNVKMNSK